MSEKSICEVPPARYSNVLDRILYFQVIGRMLPK